MIEDINSNHFIIFYNNEDIYALINFSLTWTQISQPLTELLKLNYFFPFSF